MSARNKADGAYKLRRVQAADGWALALHVYPPSRSHRGPSFRHTVVCCHGMGANHVSFDPAPHSSLARHLSQRGFRVVSVDLRGHGASEPATLRGARRYGFGFSDYLHHDLPALIEAAGEGKPVHWVGHSMGGVLLMAHIATASSSKIASAVTLGSSLDYSQSASAFRQLLPLRKLLGALPAVPVRQLARWAGRCAGRITTPYEAFNVWASNTNMALWQRISRIGFHPVSTNVMLELASAMEPGGLRSRTGTPYLTMLANQHVPVLCVTGDKDVQCPPEAAQSMAIALEHGGGAVRVLGPRYGEHDHYGHFDMLIGKRAPSEVFPMVYEWLAQHD